MNLGLGILHLGNFARALRLRWLWKEWEEDRTMMNNLDTMCDTTDRFLFAAATSITIGDGTRTSFWSSAWLQG
jgi:glycerol kinase